MSLKVDIQKRMGSFRLNVHFCSENGVLGLLGASGCGKSVTLKCIAGLLKPDEGRIELNGRVLFDSREHVNLPPQQRRVGYLFQHYALFPNMTVEQNIAGGVRHRDRRKEETNRLMAMFRLEDCRGHFPNQLSGGQQQRTALARILASEPDVLLLDEPFSALDNTLKRQVELELVERLEQFPGLVVLVSHDRGEVRRLCRNVCVMERGASQPLQKVEQLFSHPATLSACRLSGCENISAVRRREDGLLEALDWGITTAPPSSLPGDITHIGIRADCLKVAEGPGEHIVSLRVKRVIEDITHIALVLAPSEREDVSLYMELTPEAWQGMRYPGQLWVKLLPEDLLLLSDSH